MTIQFSNELTNVQYRDVENLINSCKQFENLEGISFLESEMNEYPDFPCFYFLYENATLISFLSVFIPNTSECEIYGYTHPAFRRQGYIKKLITSSMKNIEKHSIKEIFFVTEPNSTSGILTLKAIGAIPYVSEYMMKYDNKFQPNPRNDLLLKKRRLKDYDDYHFLHHGKTIGRCKVDHFQQCSTIFDFEISEKWRRKGYGKESLNLTLEDLLRAKVEKIVLHLNSANEKAYQLYTKNHFTIIKQIDYWKMR